MSVNNRPILFSTKLVELILKREKTQTRRVIKPRNQSPAPITVEPWIVREEWQSDDAGLPLWRGRHPDYPTGEKWFSCPFGSAGSFLRVREAWAKVPRTAYAKSPDVWQTVNPENSHEACIYKAGWTRVEPSTGWKPSIHQPRWASRILLQVKQVRVERLQEITPEDAIAEGIPQSSSDPVEDFKTLWNDINSSRGFGWDTNPWVWVVEFKLHTEEGAAAQRSRLSSDRSKGGVK